MQPEELFAEIVGGNEAKFAAAEASHGKALRGVMSQLRAGGMSVVEILRLIPLIVDLIQQYGPMVAEVVQKVKDLFDKK